MTTMESLQGTVIQNIQVQPGFFELELKAPTVAKNAKCGQFVMVRPNGTTSPLLGRPLGIYDTNPDAGTISLLYAVKGEGTQLLSLAKPGQQLPLVAPLGRSFSFDENAKNVLVVAGGVGVAPLYPVMKQLKQNGTKTRILLGAATAKSVLAMDKLATQGYELDIFTDDGTMGTKGYPTQLLETLLAATEYDRVYCCGPMIMMEAVAKMAQAKGVYCEVSLEERMGCGVGICMGCVCPHKNADGSQDLARVCYEGPVFPSTEVF